MAFKLNIDTLVYKLRDTSRGYLTITSVDCLEPALEKNSAKIYIPSPERSPYISLAFRTAK